VEIATPPPRRRGRPRLGVVAQSGAERQRRWRERIQVHAVRLEAWVRSDVALFFERRSQQSGTPLHRVLASALEAHILGREQEKRE